MGKKSLAGIAVLVAGLAAIGVLAYRHPYNAANRAAIPRLLWTRDNRCSAADAWRSVGNFERLWDRIDEISDDIEITRSDPAGYDLASVSSREYWIPHGNRLALAEVLGEQEEDVYALKGRGVHPGDIVLDCGANVGAYTRHALDAGARLVVAVEIAPENLECLRRNFAPEIQAGRVILYPKGVWDRDDVLVLRTVGSQTGSNSVAMFVPGSQEGPRVPLTTIDKLVEELHLERVDYIKMDIEGAEKKALAGAKQTVARFKPRMAIALEHLPDDTEAIPALIAKLWPGRKVECGPCVWVKSAHVNGVRPDVLFVN